MEPKNADNLERIDLPISGMSCASCAARIEKELASLEGVSHATVNFAAEKATVLFHPDQTDLPRLIEKVADIGYSAKVEKVVLPIQVMTCASCFISVRGIQKRIEYYSHKTGVSVSCHRLRHTMANQLLNADAMPVTIQELL